MMPCAIMKGIPGKRIAACPVSTGMPALIVARRAALGTFPTVTERVIGLCNEDPPIWCEDRPRIWMSGGATTKKMARGLGGSFRKADDRTLRASHGKERRRAWRAMSADSSYPKPLPSMVRFGGVGGFFSCPSVQVRKCRPTRGFFTFRQTLMPEFDQPALYNDMSRRHRRSVAYIAVGLWSYRPRSALPTCQNCGIGIGLCVVTIYFRSERKGGSGSRPCGFYLRGRIIPWRSFIERVIHATSLSKSHSVIRTFCNYAPHRNDIGVH